MSSTPNPLSTEYEFTLPIGYIDADGVRHTRGVMRLATAADEILPMKDPRVQANPAYFSIIVLSRVIVQLGTLRMITTQVIEDLFAADFNYLQSFYNRINDYDRDASAMKLSQGLARPAMTPPAPESQG